jgi:hypothetical protein
MTATAATNVATATSATTGVSGHGGTAGAKGHGSNRGKYRFTHLYSLRCHRRPPAQRHRANTTKERYVPLRDSKDAPRYAHDDLSKIIALKISALKITTVPPAAGH